MSFFKQKLISSLLLISLTASFYGMRILLNYDLIIAQEQPNSSSNSLNITDDIAQYEKGLNIFDSAIKIAREIKEPYEKNQAFLSIIDSLTQIGEIDKALSLIPEIKDQQTLMNSLALIAQVYIDQGQYDQALSILQQALNSHPAETDFSPDLVEEALKNLAIALAKDGKIDQALDVNKLIKLDLRKAQALNGIVTELINLGNSTKAKEILEQTLTIAQKISNDEYAYEGNGSCNNYKFELLGEISKNLRQLALIDEARKIALEVRGCGGASAGLIYTYQSDAFLALIEDTNDLNLLKKIGDDSQKIFLDTEKLKVWHGLALKLIALNQVELGFNFAEKITKEIVSVTSISSDYESFNFAEKENCLTEIAVELTKIKREDLALKLIETINHPLKPEARDLGMIALAQILKDQGNTQQYSLILKQYLQFPDLPLSSAEGENDQSFLYEQTALTKVASALVKLGEIERVLDSLTNYQKDKQPILDGVVLGLIETQELNRAWTFIQSQNIQGTIVKDLALKFLENNPQDLTLPLQIAQYLQDFNLQKELLTVIIPQVKEESQLTQILQSFKIDDLDQEEDLTLTGIIASKWIQLGKNELILSKIENLNNVNRQVYLIKNVLPFLTQSQDLMRIEKLLKNVIIAEDILAVNYEIFVLKNDYNEAVNLLSLKWLELDNFAQASHLINLLQEPYQKVSLLEKIIANLTNINSLEKTLILLNQINLEDNWYKNNLIQQIAKKMVTMGEVDRAVQTSDLINNDEGKVELLRQLGLQLIVKED